MNQKDQWCSVLFHPFCNRLSSCWPVKIAVISCILSNPHFHGCLRFTLQQTCRVSMPKNPHSALILIQIWNLSISISGIFFGLWSWFSLLFGVVNQMSLYLCLQGVGMTKVGMHHRTGVGHVLLGDLNDQGLLPKRPNISNNCILKIGFQLVSGNNESVLSKKNPPKWAKKRKQKRLVAESHSFSSSGWWSMISPGWNPSHFIKRVHSYTFTGFLLFVSQDRTLMDLKIARLTCDLIRSRKCISQPDDRVFEPLEEP